MSWKDLALAKGATVVLELDEAGTTPFDNLASSTDPTVSGTPTKGEPGLGYDNAASVKLGAAVLDTGIVNANLSKCSVEFVFKLVSGQIQILTARGSAPGVVAGFGSDFTGGASGQVWFGFNGDNMWKQVATNATYKDGQPHHAVLVWDGTSGVTWAPEQVRLYIDKVLIGATNYRTYNTIFPTAPVGNNGTWRLGAVAGGNVDDWLGNFAIYPGIALVQADVDELYGANFNPPVAPTDAPAPTVDAAYSGGGIVLWNGVTYATGYDYRIDGGAVTDAGNTRKLTLAGLTNGQTYTVEVRARNDLGVGPWAAVALTPTATDLYDDFERADSTTSLGAPPQGGPYTIRSGTPGISAGKAYAASGSVNATAPASSLDQSVELTLGAASTGIGAIVRYATESDYWLLWVGNGTIDLDHRSATAWDINEQVPRITWAVGDKVRIDAIGKWIRVYRNGVLAAQVQDQFRTAGATAVGIRMDPGAGRIDRVIAKPIGADPVLAGGATDWADDIAGALTATLFLYKGRDTKAADQGAVS